jgi:hypothetical protein
MIYRVINSDTQQLWNTWDSFDKAKSECDTAAARYLTPFVVERAETVWSSQTLDEVTKEAE